MKAFLVVLLSLGLASAAGAATAYSDELVGTMDDWSVPISSSDALNGLIGTVEEGGFHGAFPTEANPAALTDGVAGPGVAAVLADFSSPSLKIRYDEANGWVPTMLKEVRTFGANHDGRVRQNVDVEWKDAAGNWNELITEAITGSYATSNGGQWNASLIRIRDDSDGLLVGGQTVYGLRFTFWMVDNSGDWFLPRNDPALNTSSIIKEIDAIVPEPATLSLLALGGLLLRRRQV